MYKRDPSKPVFGTPSGMFIQFSKFVGQKASHGYFVMLKYLLGKI